VDQEVRTVNRSGPDDPLRQAALAVENEHELAAEMAEWEVVTVEDGLCDSGCVPLQPRQFTNSARPVSRPLRALRGLR